MVEVELEVLLCECGFLPIWRRRASFTRLGLFGLGLRRRVRLARLSLVTARGGVILVRLGSAPSFHRNLNTDSVGMKDY